MQGGREGARTPFAKIGEAPPAALARLEPAAEVRLPRERLAAAVPSPLGIDRAAEAIVLAREVFAPFGGIHRVLAELHQFEVRLERLALPLTHIDEQESNQESGQSRAGDDSEDDQDDRDQDLLSDRPTHCPRSASCTSWTVPRHAR